MVYKRHLHGAGMYDAGPKGHYCAQLPMEQQLDVSQDVQGCFKWH